MVASLGLRSRDSQKHPSVESLLVAFVTWCSPLALCPHGRGLRALACRAQNLHGFVAARSSEAAFPWLSYAVFVPGFPSSRSEGGHVALVRHCAGVPSRGLSEAAVCCWFGSGRWASRACDGSFVPPRARDRCSDGMRSHGKVFKREGFLSDHIFLARPHCEVK